HTDDFAMRVLRDLADKSLKILFRHPIFRFYFFFAIDDGLKLFFKIQFRHDKNFNKDNNITSKLAKKIGMCGWCYLCGFNYRVISTEEIFIHPRLRIRNLKENYYGK